MSAEYTLHWKSCHAGPYLYGTEIRYPKDGSVTVRAPLVPSGKVLYAWHSETSYQKDRIEPTLPLIREGARCGIRMDYTCEPAETVLFRLVFYDRQKEEIEAIVTEKDTMSFVFPEDAYQYSLELVQGGFDTLTFRSAVLTILDDEEAEETRDEA